MRKLPIIAILLLVSTLFAQAATVDLEIKVSDKIAVAKEEIGAAKVALGCHKTALCLQLTKDGPWTLAVEGFSDDAKTDKIVEKVFKVEKGKLNKILTIS